MNKKEARTIYKKKRLSLSVKDMTRYDDLMLIQFQGLDLPFVDNLFSYWPIEENNEPATHHYIGYLRFKNPGLQVAYPKSDFSQQVMRAVIADLDTPFKKHEFNIYEPESDQVMAPEAIDMVFVPMLICDSRGYRVGYGRGFYDRYLAQCQPGCIKVGFSYFEPVDSLDDANEFDVPLNLCITPHNVYVF